MNDKPVTHETVEAELQRLIDNLRGADAATVEAETARLQAMAGQVQDAPGRERAFSRAAELPRLLAGPPVPASAEFARAQLLFDRAIKDQGPAEVRIPRLEQTIEQIGQLADQAPVREAGAIRRLNSPLVRLIEHLQSSTG
ncbi:hypothetical protein [Kribbella sp. NPDC051620]|uniref:hypothetical protein n=1 Tax=Kribbella sp. NPDC051620 TaxID=3364120 RepID=UPI003791F36B